MNIVAIMATAVGIIVVAYYFTISSLVIVVIKVEA